MEHEKRSPYRKIVPDDVNNVYKIPNAQLRNSNYGFFCSPEYGCTQIFLNQEPRVNTRETSERKFRVQRAYYVGFIKESIAMINNTEKHNEC